MDFTGMRGALEVNQKFGSLYHDSHIHSCYFPSTPNPDCNTDTNPNPSPNHNLSRWMENRLEQIQLFVHVGGKNQFNVQ